MNKDIIEHIIELLKEGKEIPAEYEEDLFPNTKKEYELVYAGKERKEKIINDTYSVPFQAVKHFGESDDENEWVNKLIFGDNLQVLKHLLKMKNEGKLKNSDGTDGVRLIYIDPPFATKQDFRSKQGQRAYSDKIAGSEFIEFLRKRLILLREIMSDDGSIYIHLDSKKAQYIKIIMDEIFGESNFVNEVIWCYKSGGAGITSFSKKHDNIFFYSKNNNYLFNNQKEKSYMREGSGENPSQTYYTDESGRYTLVNVKDWWTDIGMLATSSYERINFPTQKPEKLIERIIQSSSNEGDIVLDCFAGSGTTGAVAEKLSRRWIMCDCGKLSIYTIQKRMLNLKSEIGNKGDPLKCKPFILYHDGLYYDGKLLENMQKEEYKDFVLELFGCQKRDHQINGLDFHGTLNNESVMIFDKEHFLTYEFIDKLHQVIGKNIKHNCYLIAPAGIVGFGEDYIKKGEKKYTILRIPNSIIDYIRKKNFVRLQQPTTSDDINQTIDSVGFDFIYPPKVQCNYFKDEEYTIEINEFEPIQLGSKIIEFKDSKSESIAMVMVDLDYNGEIFQIDKYWFNDELKKNDFKFSFDFVGNKIMVIYLDIFGNEKREILSKNEFIKR